MAQTIRCEVSEWQCHAALFPASDIAHVIRCRLVFPRHPDDPDFLCATRQCIFVTNSLILPEEPENFSLCSLPRRQRTRNSGTLRCKIAVRKNLVLGSPRDLSVIIEIRSTSHGHYLKSVRVRRHSKREDDNFFHVAENIK
jgi:hypothetical protein